MDKNIKHKFEIGDIVTIKSHPLSFQEDGLIDMHITHVPPFMVVKEIHIERRKKIYSESHPQSQISDKVKYACVYFNQREMKFEEKFLYESMLLPLNKDFITFHSKNYDKIYENETLIEETNNYKSVSYKYGASVLFKTHKLENRKKFTYYGTDNSNSSNKNKVYRTHTSPAFVLSGIKNNENKNIYDTKTGDDLTIYASTLYKVCWYNSFQEKISELYLPKEFFVSTESIYGKKEIDKSN